MRGGATYPAAQALVVLAHLHDNVIYQALAVGFGISTATVYRYVMEGCQVLAGMAPGLDDALERARSTAYLVLDGTVTETDRVRTRPRGADRGYYCGKTHRHGMSIQLNAAHAQPRAPGERANAQLKAWKILRRYRGSPNHLTTITAAVHTLITAGHTPK